MADYAEATNKFVVLLDDNERLSQNTLELLKLRNEVRLFREMTNDVVLWRNSNTVTSIVISNIGPQVNSQQKIRTIILTKVGDAYDRLKVDADVRALSESGLFSNVRVTEQKTNEGFVLTYFLQDRPRLISISVTGNTKYTVEELIQKLTCKVGDPLDERKLLTDSEELQKFYQESGFANTRVKYMTTIDKSGRGLVTFEINE